MLELCVTPTVARSPDRCAVVPFFAMAFGLTWLLQLPALLAHLGLMAGPAARFMGLVGLGAFGPMLAAIIAAWLEGGGPQVRATMQPFGAHRVGALWFLVALLLPGALLVAGRATCALLGLRVDGPWLYPPASAAQIAAMVVFSVGEEVGWRGFALPRLQQQLGPGVASFVIGVLWGLWHGPMLVLAGVTTPAALALLVPFFLAGSLVFTWVYNRTGQSLLVAILAHAGAHLNNSHQALPGNLGPLAVHTAAYGVLAVVLMSADRAAWRRAVTA
jgi:membrane protease YdiL (CAAX protease family)